MPKVIQLTTTLKAEFTENELLLRYPLQTKKIPIDNIKGFYTYPFLNSQDMCIISYYQEDKSKIVKICIQEYSTKTFINHLKEVAPDYADLLDKNKAEALQLLGTTDTTIRTIGIAIAICMVTISFLFLPTIWHGIFDSHLAETTIEDLYAGKLPDSRYVTLSARLGVNGLITTRRNIRNSVKTQRAYFTLLPDQWKTGDPVKVILMIDSDTRLLKEINAHKGELDIRHKPKRNQPIPLQLLLEHISCRLNRSSSYVKGI